MKQTIFLALIILLAACGGSKKLNRSVMKNFDQQGHRGCRGLMPENTIPAMRKAIDLGVTTLETDVVITKDKQVILSHEPFFNHDISTKPNGDPVLAREEKSFNIFQMTYAEVLKWDVGQRVHERFPDQQKMPAVKPTLLGMIDSVDAYCLRKNLPLPNFNIETKSQPATDGIFHPSPESFVDLLVEVLAPKNIVNRITIQSFDIRTLQYLHKKYPAYKTALLVEGNDKKIFALQLQDLGFIPAIYSPAYSLVTPLLVKQCHDAGVSLIPWTVNDLEKIRELKMMGVDGVITDYPNLFGKL